METIIYTPQNLKGTRTSESMIRINRKSAFSLSKAAVTSLGLKEGDKIALVHEAGDWYIILKADGFELRSQTSDHSLKFNCAALSKILLDSCKLEGNSYCMKVSEGKATLKDGTPAWCIITASAKE